MGISWVLQKVFLLRSVFSLVSQSDSQSVG